MIVALWTFLGGLALWAAYEWGHRTGVREMQHFADAMVTALEDLTLTDGTTIGERSAQCVKAGCKFTDEGIEHVGHD